MTSKTELNKTRQQLEDLCQRQELRIRDLENQLKAVQDTSKHCINEIGRDYIRTMERTNAMYLYLERLASKLRQAHQRNMDMAARCRQIIRQRYAAYMDALVMEGALRLHIRQTGSKAIIEDLLGQARKEMP